MNDKEKELWRVIDNVIKCCAIELQNGELSITREDVLGKSRAENLVMARCMVVEQMIHAGFSITTIATVLNRTVSAVRHLSKMSYTILATARKSDTSTKRATSSTACHTRRQQRHSWEPVGTWHTFPSTATTSRNS